MRLLTKTTLYFLAALIPLLLIAAFFLYTRFSNELKQRLDEELITEEIQWVRYLRLQEAEGTTFILRTPEIIITPVDATVREYPNIETTTGFSAKDEKRVPFRQLTHIVSIQGVPYLITLRKSLEQRTMFVDNITRIMSIVFVALFVVTLAVNWIISKTIWKPFRQSLKKISNVELQKMEAIRFGETNIKEFNELNSSLNQMASKIHADYTSMREFTENAAHEMQTPVAVGQSKLELLLQDADLKNEQVQSIVQASEALTRLSKLNQSLLLLAKIENNQFETDEQISLIDVTQKYLKLFDEMIRDKNIHIQTQFIEDWSLTIHPLLADTLISNLLGNAIKYNQQGGTISLIINENKFEVSNTSHYRAIDNQQLFKRFHKSPEKTEASTGLGLAIVKKICDANHLVISYNEKLGMHQFSIHTHSHIQQ